MPRITSHWYEGYRVAVNYSLKRSAFSIEMPEDLRIYGNHIEGATIDEVTRKFNALVRQYRDEGVHREKFILLEIEDGKENGFIDDDYHRANGKTARIQIQFVVVEQIKVHGELEYHTIGGHPDPEIRKHQSREFHATNQHTRAIKWTQDREDYLNSITESMQAMADKVYGYFADKNLDLLLDSPRPVLIPYQEAKTKPKRKG